MLADLPGGDKAELFVKGQAFPCGNEAERPVLGQRHGAFHQLAADAQTSHRLVDDDHVDRGAILTVWRDQRRAGDAVIGIHGDDARAQLPDQLPVLAAVRPAFCARKLNRSVNVLRPEGDDVDLVLHGYSLS